MTVSGTKTMEMKITQDKYRKKLDRLRRSLSMENPMRQLTASFGSLSSEEKSFCLGYGGADTPAARTWLQQKAEFIENERKGGRYFWIKD